MNVVELIFSLSGLVAGLVGGHFYWKSRVAVLESQLDALNGRVSELKRDWERLETDVYNKLDTLTKQVSDMGADIKVILTQLKSWQR